MKSYRIESSKMRIIEVLLCLILLFTMLGLPTWVFSVQSDIHVKVLPEQAVYYAGEEIDFEVQYTNNSDDILQDWNLVAEIDGKQGSIERINGNILNPETGKKSTKNHKYLDELAPGEKSDKVIFTLKLSDNAASSDKAKIKFSVVTGEITDGRYDDSQVIDTTDEEIFIEEREGAKVFSSRVESTESDSGKEGAVVSFELMNKDVEEYAYKYDLDVSANGKKLDSDEYTLKWIDEPDRVIPAVESETVKAEIMIDDPEENDEYSAVLNVKDENGIESLEEIKFASIPALLGLNANGSANFTINVNPDKDEYYPGESIEFKVTYKNTTKNNVNIKMSLSPSHGTISSDSGTPIQIGGGKTGSFKITVALNDDISSAETVKLILDVISGKNTIESTDIDIPVVMPSGITVKSGQAVTADTNVYDGILTSSFTLNNNEEKNMSYDKEIVVYKNGTVIPTSEYSVDSSLSGSISSS